MIFWYTVKNMRVSLKKPFFLSLFIIQLSICLLAYAENSKPTEQINPQEQEDTISEQVAPQIDIQISFKDGICRSKSTMMMNVLFVNKSNKPEKICVYKFYDSLLKLDIVDSFGEKINFKPKLVKAKKLSEDDWIIIPPRKTYKKSFSLNRVLYEETGQMIQPGNYIIKATYNGCSKFDPSIPDIKIDSNSLYLMVTE